jgi:predicted phage terminase large subunit-like protein
MIECLEMNKISRARLEEELIRREAIELAADFRKFVEAAWHIVEPGVPFLTGLHVEAICEHLQATAEKRIQRLLINVPPRHSKSTLVSVLYNAWLWTREPTHRVLSGSYSLQLATNDSVRTRRVITAEWYQKRWPDVVIQDDQAQKTFFANTYLGQRQVTSVGGTTTGLGGQTLIGDDLISAQQAESAVMRQQCLQWYRESFATRNNTTDTTRIIVMQRLHQNDIAGYLLHDERDMWDTLILPGVYDGRKIHTSIGWVDPRKTAGDLLWPARFSQTEMDQLKRTLGSTAFAGQIQQTPTPRGGATFRKEWCRFWYDENLGRPDPVVLQRTNGEFFEAAQKPIPKIDQDSTTASFDLAFKGGEDNDFVVGQVWARPSNERGQFYLLAQERGQWDFPATVVAIRRLLDRQNCNTVLVEDKANGAAVIASLKSEVPGIIAVNPQGGKESRANACAPLFEAGQIWLPHPAQAPWVEDYIEELMAFPRGTHDDCVDATTQALARMRDRQVALLDGEVFAASGGLLRASPWSGH